MGLAATSTSKIQTRIEFLQHRIAHLNFLRIEYRRAEATLTPPRYDDWQIGLARQFLLPYQSIKDVEIHIANIEAEMALLKGPILGDPPPKVLKELLSDVDLDGVGPTAYEPDNFPWEFVGTSTDSRISLACKRHFPVRAPHAEPEALMMRIYTVDLNPHAVEVSGNKFYVYVGQCRQCGRIYWGLDERFDFIGE